MSDSAAQKWTREEHLLALNLYCQIPFGTIHERNPKIIELASLIGRSVGSVSLKLANLSRLDPALQQRGIRGMPHGAKGEEEVWDEFRRHPEELALECQRILANYTGKPLEIVSEIETWDLPDEGLEREALVRVRVNQSFFRRRILSAYNFACCVTGLTIQPLLVASHIIPWKQDASNRLNPRNGLCLNALHDRAFDKGLMWIEDEFTIRFSPKLKHAVASSASEWLTSFEGRQLQLPKNFSPEPAFLHQHAFGCKA